MAIIAPSFLPNISAYFNPERNKFKQKQYDPMPHPEYAHITEMYRPRVPSGPLWEHYLWLQKNRKFDLSNFDPNLAFKDLW